MTGHILVTYPLAVVHSHNSTDVELKVDVTNHIGTTPRTQSTQPSSRAV